MFLIKRSLLRFNFLLLILIVMMPVGANAQLSVINQDNYPYIKFDENKLTCYNPDILNPLFLNLERLLTYGDNRIQIVHIGDSHLQADLFSGRVRNRLQEFFPGGNGGRGFVFPYTMAHTNNPYNYKVSYSGTWTNCRNVQNKDCLLGVAGISVSTTDTFTQFSISSSDVSVPAYEYTRIRVFYHCADSSYELSLTNKTKGDTQVTTQGSSYIEWELEEPTNSVQVSIRKLKSNTGDFELLGISLDTDDPGIVYNAIGVNGAQVSSFLKCALFEEQLKQLEPDLIVLSLGTNDAYGKDFDEKQFESNYQTLIDRILSKNPQAAIILTTPGDCYWNKKYPNKNNVLATQVIFALAKKNGLIVWDFFNVMGGLGSIQKWYENGLSNSGRIHLTRKGYELQGDLLFESFVKAYDSFINRQEK